jgi:hypothetical protein
MDKDRVVGSAKQVKGAVKQVVGKAVGNAKLESEGKTNKIDATRRGELLPSLGPLRRSFCPAHCVLRAHTGNEDAGKGAKTGKGRESQEASELLAQNDRSLAASHSATLATRLALPFTWAGLSSAGSRQAS